MKCKGNLLKNIQEEAEEGWNYKLRCKKSISFNHKNEVSLSFPIKICYLLQQIAALFSYDRKDLTGI
jgi:hypothetical protein